MKTLKNKSKKEQAYQKRTLLKSNSVRVRCLPWPTWPGVMELRSDVWLWKGSALRGAFLHCSLLLLIGLERFHS
jgi:hypothetical protein